jgi:hypothetical protein
VLLAVVLESDPRDPALLEWAIQSCSEALVHERCAPADASTGEAAPYRARLSWEDELHARVEVRRERDGVVALAERSVAFLPEDPMSERYRALGLVVASYVLAQRPAEPAFSPSPPPPKPAPTLRPAPMRRFAIDLALLGGPALDQGAYRAGGTVRGLVRPSARLPALGLLLAARATYRPAEPRLTWAALSLGVAGRLFLAGPLSAEARLECVIQRLFARANDRASTKVDRADLDRTGGQLGLELLYAVSPSLRLFLGGDVARMRPRGQIIVARELVGRERAVEGALLVGTRIAW